MKTFSCKVSFIFGCIVFLLTNTGWADLTVGNYTLVSSKRISRVEYQYTYRAQVINDSQDAKNVMAHVTSNTPYTTVIEGVLEFGDVASGASIESSNTLIIRHNRRYPLDWSALEWDVRCGEAVEIIGVNGGVINVTDTDSEVFGSSIQVPTNSVCENTIFLITSLPHFSDLPLFPNYNEIVSPIIEFNSSTTFNRPVNICLPINQEPIGALHLYVLDETNNEWIRQNNQVSYDSFANTACATVEHLSKYAITIDNNCNVPGGRSFYEQVNPSCIDKVRMAIYLKDYRLKLLRMVDFYYDKVNREEFQNELNKTFTEVFTQFLSLQDITNKPINELFALGSSKSVSFMSNYLGNEAASEIINYGTQVLLSYYVTHSLPAIFIAKETTDAAADFMAAYSISEINEKMYEALIADEFLMRYYSMAGDYNLLKQSLSLDQEASTIDIINAIALEGGWKNGKYLGIFDDYNPDNILSLILDVLQGVNDSLSGTILDTENKQYKIIDIGTLGGNKSNAYAINDFGYVVGTAQKSSSEEYYPFLYDGKSIQAININGSTNMKGRAIDINNAGQIVGEIDVLGRSHAFIYNLHTKKSKVLDLDLSSARSINDLGHVVGSYHDLYPKAFYYDGSTLNTLNISNFDYIDIASAINNYGQIVVRTPREIPGLKKYAYFYNGYSWVDIGRLNETHDYCMATDINNIGQIIGVSGTTYLDGHAFIFENGIMQDIGTLERYPCDPLSINDKGQVVGSSSRYLGTHAFIYENAKMKDLNEFIIEWSNWEPDGEIVRAWDVNNNGQIVGHGYTYGKQHAFLLIPIETP